MATNASQAELQAELFQLIADAQTTNYLAAASLTLAVVDLIGTFKDEIELIWKTPLRVSNGIYLWIRYFSLITVAIHISYMLREVKSDHMHRILVGVFTILPLGQYFHIGPIIMGCYSFNVPRYFTYYAVPFSVTSFVMFCLTLYKCGLTLLDNRAVKMPLISLFLRDGVFWFLTIFAVSIAELILWARGRPSLAQAMSRDNASTVSNLFRTLLIFGHSLNAVIGARILLNLKKVAVADLVTTTVVTTELFPARRELAREPWYLRTDHTLDI
ncbi:hypothetical protein B0H16DRAFT_1726700 [Mycena metata]|uniref:DUF6533 domain-containing protein n=1 Tax=Mycena metata TaxID=1033252 RepID=A0AAD7N5T2_9AGAR|nr:hypothetical protein B0H16DRAFT_1726700 [Mycena metata]